MKAVLIHAFGGLEVLEIEDIARPEPQAGELLIEVRATSVNPIDYKMRAGLHATLEQLPMTLGRDVAGVVAASRVADFAVGDEVIALLDWHHGGYAEAALAGLENCAPKPRSLDFAAAATVPLAALTAWQALFDHGGLRAGQSVLIHGAAGGVGHFAVQFARVRGATVYATASARHREFVQSLGAAEVIDYRTENFEDRVADMDVVIDLVGGTTRERSWGVLKRNGILVSTVGAPDPELAEQHGVRAAGFMASPKRAELEEIVRLIDDGQVRPVVSLIFPLDDIRAAQGEAEAHAPQGKIAVVVA